ncbi:MAG: uracil-DNA glycosylase [Nanoarchaeales archaeon]
MDLNPKEKLISEINEKIKICKLCDLYKIRKNAVPGEGNINSKIMLIGLGPGKDEDIQGRPFVGAAGKFLNELLNLVGIKREEVYITNVVKCIPPNNKPNEHQIFICTSNYLDKQIEVIKPRLIITLGEIATKYIFEKNGKKFVNMSVHGKIFEFKNYFVLPMFHPASALYNPSLKEKIINDWLKNKEFIKRFTISIE